MKICPVCHKKQKLIFLYQKFYYYRCGNCQLVSAYPLPTPEMITTHYAGKFKKGNYEILHKYPRQYIQVYADFVKILYKRLHESDGMTLKGKKILDIGCFTGDFLQLLQKEGSNVYGLELQNDAVRIADKKLPGRILQADIMSYKFREEQYDIITLLGIVEHVIDPLSLLRKSFQLLKKGGIIMIQTPNSSSLLARLAGKYWPPYSPVEHIHIFSKKGLRQALETCGFNDQIYQPHWKKLPVGYVYNNLNNFGPEFHRILKPFDSLLNNSRLILPFYGGEMLVTAIRK